MKKTQLRQNKIVVQKSPVHGYGVYAQKDMRKGEILEDCYLILTKGGDNVLEDFYFEAKKRDAMVLGFGSIYNHSDDPNADYKLNLKTRIATFFATKKIRKGEEIFVSYGNEWFSSRNLKAKKK